MTWGTPPTSLSAYVHCVRGKLRGKGVGAQLARGSATSLTIKVVGAACGLLSRLVLTNLLGAAVFGTYYYVFSLATMLSLLAALGLPAASVRYVAEYKSNRQWGELKGFLRRSRHWAAMAAAGTALVGVILLLLPDVPIPEELRHAAAVGAVLLLLQAPLHVCSFQLQGFKEVVAAQVPSMVLRPLLVAGSVAVLTQVWGVSVSGAGALGLTATATLATLLLSLWILERAMPSEVRPVDAVYRNGEWLRTSAALLVVTGIHLLLSRTDVLVVGWILGTTKAGFYGVATELAQHVAFGLMALNVIAAPMISELYSQRRFRELRRLLRLASVTAGALAAPLLAAFILFGDWFLDWFGLGFETATTALAVLSAGQFVNALAGPVGLTLTMSGHQAIVVRILLLALVLNVVLNVALIPAFGLAGAAIATAGSMILSNAVMSLEARRIVVDRRTQRREVSG